jgi:hypothetical protein
MFIVPVGQQYDCSEIGGSSPKFRKQIALKANALDPLVFGDGLAQTASPVQNAVDFRELFFDGRNLFGERDANGLVGFRIEMHLLRAAVEVAGLGLPVRALALFGWQLDRLPAGKMKRLVNVNQPLHVVVARGDISETARRISEGLGVDHGR